MRVFLRSWGLEEQATFKFGDFNLVANATYQHVIEAEDYSVDDNNIANVPSFTTNLIGTYNISKDVFVNISAKYISSQFSPVTGVGTDSSILDNYTNNVLIMNTGVNVYKNGVTFDLRVRNIANTKYYQGGSTRFAYPQEGRWITTSISYKLNNK